MNSSEARTLLGKLHGLRAELTELAFVLDRGGRLDAADVAMTLSGRVGELCEELAEPAVSYEETVPPEPGGGRLRTSP